MAEQAPAPDTVATSWPLAAGEHPDLPRLSIEVYEGHPGYPVKRGKPPVGVPPYARVHFTATRVVNTGNPDRLRAYAARLLAAADALEAEHQAHAERSGQLPLEQGK